MHANRGQHWATLGATATGFFVLVAHALLETARDALFLSNIPASRLPWMYLVLALLWISISELGLRSRRRLDARRLLIASQVVAVAGTLVTAVLVAASVPFAYYALYVWAGVASMSVLVRHWQHLSGSFTATEAKRLFPLIGAGGVAGALVGYALAESFSRTIGVAASIPVAAVFFAASMIGPLLFFGPVTSDTGDDEMGSHDTLAERLRAVVENTYLRRVAVILVLASMTVTLADFVFKSVVAREVDPVAMGSFFARAYFAFNVASLFILFVVVKPLVQRLGVTEALALLPAVLLLGGAGVLMTGGLIAAIVLKSGDGVLRFSSHKTAVELLYVPVSNGLRDAVKGMMEVLTHRVGQALGSLLILVMLIATDSVRLPTALVVVFCLVWIALALRLREDYLDLFRATLSRGPDEVVLDFPDLDVGSLETLVAALSSPQNEKVVAAIDLLEQKSKGHLVPGLVLYHPSPMVVARALDLFARTRRKDVLPLLPRLVDHEYAEVRAAALRAGTALRPDEATLRRALEHHCPVVNVTAIVGLTVGGWIPPAQGVEELIRHAENDSELARPMIAHAIRYHPLPAFAPVLARLANDTDAETRRQAVIAMRAGNDPRFVPALLRALAERSLREDAREALVVLGSPALAALVAALADPATPVALRMHLPRTIAQFQSQRAADVLVEHLTNERRAVIRYKTLRGLGRMVSHDPHLRLDPSALDRIVENAVKSLFQRLHWQIILQAGALEQPARCAPGHELLLQLLRDKEQLAIERLFRMLGLRYRGEDWSDVFDGIASEDPVARSSGRELLESALPSELGTAIAGFTDDAAPQVRLDTGTHWYEPIPLAYEELVELLAGEPGDTLKLIARYYAVEIGLRTDAERFVRDADEEPGWVDSMRELAARMRRDFSVRPDEVAGDA